ncbi:sulfatase-like hydrolase/transferase [Actinomadura keratinilytica]|uniref:sulfatase-like hydrolase/transferase n=1 Tax=Actinomadura keratinilytica TaxID=547461 RepID=UPI0036233617
MYRPRRLGTARPPLVIALLLALTLGLAGCLGIGLSPFGGDRPSVAPPPKKPNIVFVLTDDLSWDLVPHMRRVQDMRAKGTTFGKFIVADSLCCTSRATIFTGRYPHNTGVRTNFPPDGGYGVFKARGGEQASYTPALRNAGYRTALMGKYLNGYLPADTQGGPRPYVPPGWDEWAVAGNGYPEYNYNLNENGKLVHYGNRPQDYLTDVLANKSVDFINRAAADRKPFFLQVATFAPHGPFVPAPRHSQAFPQVTAPGRRRSTRRTTPTSRPGCGRGPGCASPASPASTPASATGSAWCRRWTSSSGASSRRSPPPATTATPTWSSAPTTASTWASTGWRAAR